VLRLEFEGLLEDLSLAAVGVQGRGGGQQGTDDGWRCGGAVRRRAGVERRLAGKEDIG
jgi:hypothetical protein